MTAVYAAPQLTVGVAARRTAEARCASAVVRVVYRFLAIASPIRLGVARERAPPPVRPHRWGVAR